MEEILVFDWLVTLGKILSVAYLSGVVESQVFVQALYLVAVALQKMEETVTLLEKVPLTDLRVGVEEISAVLLRAYLDVEELYLDAVMLEAFPAY